MMALMFSAIFSVKYTVEIFGGSGSVHTNNHTVILMVCPNLISQSLADPIWQNNAQDVFLLGTFLIYPDTGFMPV